MPTDGLHRFTLAQAMILTVPAFLIMLYYFRRALTLGRFLAVTFLASIAYGLSLELFDIRASEAYYYTDLALMVGRAPNWVPLFIGVCWGGILFAAMQMSDALRLPTAWRPLYDGALGLSLDLVLDPVASNSVYVATSGTSCAYSAAPTFGGLGLWTWCVPQAPAPPLWFSVPVSNFIGWFIVLALASAAVRIVRDPLRGASRPLVVQVVMLAVGLALAAGGLVLSLTVILQVATTDAAQWAILAALVALPVALVIAYRKRIDFGNRLDAGLLAFPAYLLLWEVGTFFVEGIDREQWPATAAVLVAAALFSALLWLMPSLARVLGRTPAPSMQTA